MSTFPVLSLVRVQGMPGATAYFGLKNVGPLKKDDLVLVRRNEARRRERRSLIASVGVASAGIHRLTTCVAARIPTHSRGRFVLGERCVRHGRLDGGPKV